MLTLWLLRHAKSDWGNHALSDFDRPLSRRGEAAAPRMGHYLAKAAPNPDLVLCSAANRTRQTWNLIAPCLPTPPPLEVIETLYLADVDTLLKQIHATPPACTTLLIVGHNPGLQDLALGLCRTSQTDPLRRAVAHKFPTCALVRVTFQKRTWAKVTLGSGKIAEFMTPKKLDA
jgi:phosphohistidine phosphatase